MLQISRQKFNKSIKNIIVLIGFLLVFILVALIFNNEDTISNLEVDLDENGIPSINKLVINEIINICIDYTFLSVPKVFTSAKIHILFT